MTRPAGLTRTVGMTVNGEAVEVEVEVRQTLLDVVRHRLGLTGTHGGCEQGSCGACTVLLDGDAVRSCLVLGVAAAGHAVTTIEAVGTPGHLHPVQRALSDHHGLQCGFCTPGMVLTVVDLLRRSVAPTEAEVRSALAGNLCRCTGYTGLVEAVSALASAAGDVTAVASTALDGGPSDGTAPDGTPSDGTAADETGGADGFGRR